MLAPRGPGQDQPAGCGQQQGGDLQREPGAHRLQGEGGRCFRSAHAPRHPHPEPAQEVGGGDHEPRDGVSAHELAGAVHGAEEVGLPLHLAPPLPGRLLRERARVQLGVDAHLLAGHGVQREAGSHLRHAARAVGHHHELHGEQDGEQHEPHDQVPAHHEASEGSHHAARRPLGEDQPRHGHVEPQAAQGRGQQQGGEHRQLQRVRGVRGGHQHDDGQGEVADQQQVHERGGQRHHQRGGDQEETRGQGQVAALEEPLARGHRGTSRRRPARYRSARISATARYRAGGMAPPSGTRRYKACASGGFGTVGTP
ncbi:hypothetical protein HRbin32_01329 [bacterium HR32]|nr:hypothetical protein HRbin32_01329 [bacterium HR32]